MLETVLGPTWVWLGANEVPSNFTIGGGIIVLGAAAARAIIGIRQSNTGRQ